MDPEQYGFAARQTFFRMGEVILELIGGDEPTGDGPAMFFGLAYTVTSESPQTYDIILVK